jgi:hypothetical protein
MELVMITPVDNEAFSDGQLGNVKLVSDVSETFDINVCWNIQIVSLLFVNHNFKE